MTAGGGFLLPPPATVAFRLPAGPCEHSHVDRFRLIQVGLGGLLVAVIALSVAFWPEGEPVEVPEPVVRLSPGEGDQVPRQVPLLIDLEPGYAVRIFLPIDGAWVEVSQREIDDGLAADGIFTWTPGIAQTLSQWNPDQRVRILVESTTGVLTVDEYEWSFRTY